MAPGSDAAVQYSKDRLDLGRVRLMNGNETIELNGALGIGENAATNAVDVAVRNVDLVELDRLLLQNRGLRGTLNGDAKITGTLKAPVVDGHLAVTGGGFQGFSYQSLDVKANYALGDPAHTDSGRVVLDTKLVQGPGVELNMSGTLPLTAMRPNPPGVTGHVEAHAGDQIDLKVQSSSIDLGIRSRLHEAADQRDRYAAGRLACDWLGRGSPRQRHGRHSWRCLHGPGGKDLLQRPYDDD